MRILVVEDSIPLAETLQESLVREGYLAESIHDGKSGLLYAESGIYDLIILDLKLPEMSGYEVLANLRNKKSDIPVIILSAKSELDDKVEGFQCGADDYLTKPFEMQELLMRIQAITRRRGGGNYMMLTLGDLVLDLNGCEMRNQKTNKSISISGKEFQLLELFLHNAGRVLEKEQIATKIWGFESETEYNNVEVYVSFLRRKLKQLKINVQIRAIRGVGYIMEEIND